MEDVGICYGHLVYFIAIGYILWPFGKCCGHIVYFLVWANWVRCTKKNLSALLQTLPSLAFSLKIVFVFNLKSKRKQHVMSCVVKTTPRSCANNVTHKIVNFAAD
jgi:hypothetical protein